MNVRVFLTLAALINLFYGAWYFLAPDNVASVYGFAAASTELSQWMLRFLGVFSLSTGVMCAVGRNAEKSPGRTAILAAQAVAGLLCFYLDVKTLLGTPGTMDWVDTVVNGALGFGAALYLYRDRKSQ
ncbi:MAG: hypothetical protein HYX71_13270 [Opitutae bacterium]|nr:hypothetical protein [Opitutae bacterium]